MTNIALIFPGQGAQKVGMGKEFFDSHPASREIFEQADQILNKSLSTVIFEGPAEKLTSTAYCQPAILTTSVAILKAFQSHNKFSTVKVLFSAGLSLGEYSALVAAESLAFENAIRLVEKRAAFMEEATHETAGTMAAIIGFNKDLLKAICEKTKAEIANYNSVEQIVITGKVDCVQEACRLIKEAGAKTVIPLDVSGAFHSSLMRSASKKFIKVLENTVISPARLPVISNVHAKPETSPDEIRTNLSHQIVSSVCWDESIQYIASQGVLDFIEIGPGKVLKGLIRKINPALRVFNIERPDDIENLPFS